jgi:hypothetical protein
MGYELTTDAVTALTANPSAINPAISKIEVAVRNDWTGETALFFRVSMKRSFAAAATAAVGAVLGRISMALQARAQPLGIPTYVEFTGGTARA